jgi:hypothetical protein
MNYEQFYKWVTEDYKKVIDIKRSKERIVETNEIFTSLDIVLFGLENTYPEEYFKDPTITYCDSCAGEGVWLVGMALLRMKNGLSHEDAVSTLFSIDYRPDNTEATLIRLSGDILPLKQKLSNNFATADGLKYHRRWDGSYPYDEELKEQEFEQRLSNLFDFG